MDIKARIRQWMDSGPLWLRCAYTSARGYRRRLTEMRSLYRQFGSALKLSQWWDAERIRDHQDAQVRWIVAHAYENVPFYREWFDAAGVRPGDIRTQDDLSLIPKIDKQIVREQQQRMVVAGNRRVVLTGTSGTTGTAVVVQLPPEYRALHRAVINRFRERFGVRFCDPELRFGARRSRLGPRTRPPYWLRDFGRHLVSVSPSLLTDQTIPVIARWICDQRFDHITGWPTPMLLVANYMRENGLRLRRRPRLIECTSETLMESGRLRLEETFGGPVRGLYDMTEFAGNLSMCEHERYHLDFETCCLQTEPVPGGNGVCRLIWTGWGNPHMPFIRYDVGDHATPLDGPCPCGRQSATFATIDGRIEDFIRTPDGRIAFGLNVHLPSAREVQVVQRRLEEIEVLVVPGPDYDPSQEAEMLRRLRERVGEVIGIHIQKVDSIPRTPSGKFRAVVSELPKDATAPAAVSGVA